MKPSDQLEASVHGELLNHMSCFTVWFTWKEKLPISSASSAAFPPAPSEPVCGMLMPILTGAGCASAAALNANPNTNDASLMTSSLCGYCNQSSAGGLRCFP